MRSRKVEGLRFTKVGFENVATNVKGKRKTFHILLEIAMKKPPKISKQLLLWSGNVPKKEMFLFQQWGF